jgi:hypothetical protein
MELQNDTASIVGFSPNCGMLLLIAACVISVDIPRGVICANWSSQSLLAKEL